MNRGVLLGQSHERLIKDSPSGVEYKIELSAGENFPLMSLLTGSVSRGNKYSKHLLDIVKSASPQGQIIYHYTSFHPDDIEKCIADYLQQDEDIENLVVHPTKYKIKYTFKSEEFDTETKKAVTHTSDMKIRIYKYDYDSYCVEFCQLKGKYDDFTQASQEVLENILQPFNVWNPVDDIMEEG